jgi:hypothetical protein
MSAALSESTKKVGKGISFSPLRNGCRLSLLFEEEAVGKKDPTQNRRSKDPS